MIFRINLLVVLDDSAAPEVFVGYFKSVVPPHTCYSTRPDTRLQLQRSQIQFSVGSLALWRNSTTFCGISLVYPSRESIGLLINFSLTVSCSSLIFPKITCGLLKTCNKPAENLNPISKWRPVEANHYLLQRMSLRSVTSSADLQIFSGFLPASIPCRCLLLIH